MIIKYLNKFKISLNYPFNIQNQIGWQLGSQLELMTKYLDLSSENRQNHKTEFKPYVDMPFFGIEIVWIRKIIFSDKVVGNWISFPTPSSLS